MKTDVESKVTNETITCLDIQTHVNYCFTCQKRLSFDPVEKALLKSHSIKNEIIELTAYIATGIIIILLLYLILEFKQSVKI